MMSVPKIITSALLDHHRGERCIRTGRRRCREGNPQGADYTCLPVFDLMGVTPSQVTLNFRYQGFQR